MRAGVKSDAVRPRPAAVAVADLLRKRVALGQLGPGERLPTERELADALGVGRTTVRAALRLLGDEGLLRTTRGRSGGTVVLDDDQRPPTTRPVTDDLLREVHDNFDLRLAVESAAARFAAERATASERRAIGGLADGFAESMMSWRALDSRFHLAIADACCNRQLRQIIGDARADFFRWADAAWEAFDWQSLSPEVRSFGAKHSGIAAAIVEGEPALAQARMNAHLEEGKAQFVAVIRGAMTSVDA